MNPALKFSVTWLPFIATVVYVLAGLVLSVNLSPTDPNLPIESWINSGNGSTTAIHSTSGFVIATYENGQFGLAYTLTVFMIITAILTANTSLYVASRTLFGLTRSADVEKTDPLFVRFLAQFGRTNSHNVPLRALVASSFFIWVPLIYFDAHSSASVSWKDIYFCAKLSQANFLGLGSVVRHGFSELRYRLVLSVLGVP